MHSPLFSERQLHMYVPLLPDSTSPLEFPFSNAFVDEYFSFCKIPFSKRVAILAEVPVPQGERSTCPSAKIVTFRNVASFPFGSSEKITPYIPF